ncbi:hypothetical protein Anapl_02334 [Anas platyrhynchos]|uniref:Uncharacterized protein n=1 Tax=Anas platyrhynchos TaxID=8839 RepID=R0JVF5_ANAPL|nr:hypothetical protein Anapl_02334 [Anas platyrhynchos]
MTQPPRGKAAISALGMQAAKLSFLSLLILSEMTTETNQKRSTVHMDAPVNQTHVDRLSGDEHKYRALAAFCTIKERNVQTLFMHENLFSIPNQQREFGKLSKGKVLRLTKPSVRNFYLAVDSQVCTSGMHIQDLLCD